METFVKLNFIDAQHFMKGGDFETDELFYDSSKDVYFISKSKFDKCFKDEYSTSF